ncbi:fetuin-B [Esox lucius]|uniref:Cystatin fetuin-B-type domain-containing protein n=1 Tax=Esox lucius TaxID=8010 RepID=A0A3P8YSF0_ESOLU|nr:fetuin-B [Esox lucius]
MMKRCALLLLACLYVHSAPLETDLKPGSCKDAVALGAAGQALGKINKDRREGYVFALHRLSNVHQMNHGETGVVFYLTMDVLETKCHVLSRKNEKDCEVRPTTNTPVYGQCKAAIYMNRVHRVVRLYKYNCVVRPASAAKVWKVCPDCPSAMSKDNEKILKAATLSMAKFNKESNLANYFAILNITRATSSMGMATFYNAEFTIQETTCANSTNLSEAPKCPLMDCEFAHKGHCRGSNSFSHTGEEFVQVDCDIFENENSEKEKKAHQLGGETDHSHTYHAGEHGKDHTHDAAGGTSHSHDHTKDHKHDKAQGHKHGAHDHSHGVGAASVHTHHAEAHNHSADAGPHTHHNYKHGVEGHTHDHDHELALDHAHKHTHLHEHEHHHHHHHDHKNESKPHVPRGTVTVLPALGLPVTLPSFPDQPVGEQGVTLPMVQDPEIPGMNQPTILLFPTTMSPQCPAEVTNENNFVKELFAEDPLF